MKQLLILVGLLSLACLGLCIREAERRVEAKNVKPVWNMGCLPAQWQLRVEPKDKPAYFVLINEWRYRQNGKLAWICLMSNGNLSWVFK